MSTSKIERLKAIRGAHRGVCTKLERETSDLISQEPTEEITSRLEVISCLLEGKQKTLSDIDEQITSLCDLNDITKEIEDSESIVARIIECRKKIKDAKPVVISSGQQPTIYVQSDTTQSHTSNVVKPRLPKLSLPKFKGDVTKWTSFWDSFNNAIHLNSDISPIDKFNYLNAQLEGNAARAIQGLTLTSANYTDAIKMLQERFGKPQIIISAHMDEILKIQASTDGRLSSLRYVYDRISVNARGLASLGVSSDQYGSLLVPIIMSKLPSDVRLQIARKNTNEIWKIDDLLEAIKFEIDARESSEGTKTSGIDNRKPSGNNKGHMPLGGSALFTKTTGSGEFKIRCAFCSGLHYSASCEVVTAYQSRKEILAKHGRCYNCLRKGHHLKDCTSERNCRHCNKRHHQSICDKVHVKKLEETPTQVSSDTTTSETVTTTTTSNTAGKKRHGVLLQTARAIALDETGDVSVSVRILLDNGSQRSYLTDNLRSKLKLKSVQREKLNINTFGENRFKTQKSDLVHLRLQRPGNPETIDISALTFPVICSALPLRVNLDDHPHLQDLDLAEDFDNDNHDTIDVLIGSDYYWDIVSSESVRGESGPTAVNSKLGWLVSGPTDSSTPYNNASTTNLIISGAPPPCQFETDDEVVAVLRRFGETDSIGIRDDKDLEEKFNGQPSLSVNQSKQPVFEESDGRYEVGLPWIEDYSPSSTNYRMCENRLKSLHHKLKNEPNLLRDYDEIVKDQLQKGIVERVLGPISDATEEKSKGVHYSPHHAVVRKNRETTKVRVVYDGSAKYSKEERSLNDCLEVGENYIPHVFDQLTKFRWNAIGLTGDIEKAFLMVGIKPVDRDMLRFLWYEDPFSSKPEIAVYRFNRLVFGLRPSPSILGATIEHHLRLFKQSEPEMVELLEKSLYVDDLITGEENEEKAFNVYKKSKEIMAKGGFNLRKWNSNSHRLLKSIENYETLHEHAKSTSNVTTEDDESYAKSSN